MASALREMSTGHQQINTPRSRQEPAARARSKAFPDVVHACTIGTTASVPLHFSRGEMRLATVTGLVLGTALCVAALQHARGAELLTNPGFEDGTAPWQANEGQLTVVASPHSGAWAGELDSLAQESEVYQAVAVQPAQSYEFSGWFALFDPVIDQVFLRISWFDTQSQFVASTD